MIKPKESLYQQATKLIQQLSQEKLRIAIDYLMYLQDRKALEATGEILAVTEKQERPLGILKGKASYKIKDDFKITDEELLTL